MSDIYRMGIKAVVRLREFLNFVWKEIVYVF